MVENKLTIDNLGGMIKRGFDENTEQHQRIFTKLEEITLKLDQASGIK